MMHDFALTARYVVLLDLPVTFSLTAVAAGRELPYVWNPDHPARVGLLPRDGSGPVRWFGVEPCWVFHCLNAYDDDQGRVVVDLCQYNESFDVSTLWAAHGPVTLDRWTIDPAAGTVTQRRLDDRGQEFPRVDDRIISRPHRYGYSAVIGEVNRAITVSGDFSDDAFANAILRHDLVAGTVQAREFGRDAAVGEAVFAPAAPDAAEDDGYVLTFVHNPDRGASDLVILAARDFLGDPVATVHLPARVPLGFHGSWIADQ
jgi:carotenoid cleavage dioxygenase